MLKSGYIIDLTINMEGMIKSKKKDRLSRVKKKDLFVISEKNRLFKISYIHTTVPMESYVPTLPCMYLAYPSTHCHYRTILQYSIWTGPQKEIQPL